MAGEIIRLGDSTSHGGIVFVFRRKLDTHSTANRSPIPRQTGHPVQRKLDSDSLQTGQFEAA